MSQASISGQAQTRGQQPNRPSHSQLQPGKAGLVIKKDNTRHVASKDVEKVGNNKGRKAYQCLIKLGGLAPNKEKHYNNTANRYGTCYTLAFWTDYQLEQIMEELIQL
ncbi:Os03g0278366 [Oryza sativa Japonica Group]|jgi:hypothetical protein|uniref:Uncharacterized protein n=2 Tax=Oryza sativa subsp. japonica TaxID=39947 RepID=A0A8J8XUX7_ORYSJ|nr:hypothetical protein OsJ_10346 [Oryza sativa Japonica Group]BAS83542.1 Os03g0278366 [Oryza sativa Japonica Group]